MLESMEAYMPSIKELIMIQEGTFVFSPMVALKSPALI